MRAWGGGTMQPEKLALVSTRVSPEELILRDFAATIGRKRYEHWFQKQTQVWLEGDEVVVAVSNPFLVNWMSQNFRPGLLAAARAVIGAEANIRFEVRTESQSAKSGEVVLPAQGLSLPGDRLVRIHAHSMPDNLVSSGMADSSPHCIVSEISAALDSPSSAALAILENPSDGSREALRDLCRISRAGSAAPIPMSLNVAAAAAVIVARTTTVGDSKPQAVISQTAIQPERAAGSNSKPAASAGSGKALSLQSSTASTRSSSSRPSVSKPEPVDVFKATSRTPGPKSAPEKTTAEKSTVEKVTERPLPSVSRITKESPLTLAKVKPVDEPPRPGRRFADLMELVEGTCNEFALSAARQVCQAPGVQFTTLFVHGPVGVGKTHLLEGIHRDLKQRFPSRQVVYLTAEAFANFFTQALRDHKLPTFRNKFRSIDVLIVDDIDFLDGKRGIQEEFLFTIQQLESHGRMVVVAAHGHPRLLTKMSDELRTRFLAGMVCRIDAPDVMTRRRILENKAFRSGADFAPEVFQFVADRFRNNVRELEGAFNTLLAYQRMQGRRLSLTASRNALADLERDCIRVIHMVDIEQAVCSMFGVTIEDLKSNKRQKSLSQPRMLAMYLARKHTRAAYTEIGQHFGGRNHSTVIAAEKKIQASMGELEPIVIRTQAWRVCDLIETLEQQLQAG
ncbi:MAG: chromosomal replication initiator protein DnaA [Planctomycetaceae bacterium]|nr:chromosomal replication initiator protein DnaA [Planctomycetaceae bacterium]